MKSTLRILGLVLALGFGMQVQAYSISPTDSDWDENDQSPYPKNPDAYDVGCIIGNPAAGNTYDPPPPPTGPFNGWTTDCGGAVDELYKQDAGAGSDVGPWAGYYTTSFEPDDNDPLNFKIVHDGGDSIDCGVAGCYLLVKDGNADPIWYLFDISDWNGTEMISGTGFWPKLCEGVDGTYECGRISHVSIYGGGVPVPEPGTLALVGLGLFGLGLMRRRQTG